MKKIAAFAFFIFTAFLCFAQAPQSFRYQAVVRYQDGTIVQNQMVSLRISILAESPIGNTVYSEWHRIATNEFGIANIKVGEGTIISGIFNQINWGATSYFLKTELDVSGNENYSFIGTTELLSVPYALYAENAVNVNDADADPENELQTLNLEGDTISISLGNSIVLPYDGDTISGNEIQILSIQGDTIYISQGNYIVLPFDEDFYSDNEIQALGFSNDTLYLENGGWVYLGQYIDNTDQQTLTLNGTTLSISNGNTVTFNEAVDLDGDPTNEYQFLSISNDTIYLTNGGYVKLPETFDGQYSSLIGAPINISNFNNDVGYLINPDDADADPTNEFQIISIHGDTINLSNGGFVRLPTGQNPGDMRYWDGSKWQMIPGGQESQVLMWKNGYPQWQDFYEVGSIGPAGGTIFYDKGFYSDGWRYLELSPKSTEVYDDYSIWGCYGISVEGATNSSIGSGEQNTLAIVTQCEGNGAVICNNLVYNGYDDWFLPSADELFLLCDLYDHGLGELGFESWTGSTMVTRCDYMSSTEFSSTNCKYVNVASNHLSDLQKTYKLGIRAIRAF